MVVSDGWSSYGGISLIQANFTHRWVNHKLNFVNPTDRRVHTQSIEATWGAFKRELKSKFGIPDENLGEYMAVYMFRRFFRRERLLNNLLIEMKTFGRRRNQLETTSQSPSDDSSQDDEEPIEDPEDANGTYRSENEHSDQNLIDVDNLPSDDEEIYPASDDSLPHNPSTMESDSDSDNSRPPPEKKSKRKLSGSSTQVTGKQTRRGRKPGASRRESVNGGGGTSGNTHVRGQQRRGTGAGRVQSTSGQRRTDGNTPPLRRGQSSDRGQTQRRGRQEQLSDTQDRGDVTIRRGTLRVRVNSGSVMGDRRGQSPTETGGRRPGRAQRARGRGQNLRRGHSSRVQTSRADAVTRTQQSGGARGRGRSSRGSRSGRSKGGRGK
ncbi:hypothetical protein CRE_11500 [Caenorhabditis remanei]|uniref:ISXO2-like transposase domain-containing protein n=1 Tax=Caenorhabditis remanei TaxID=31234 RepID=E3NH31_CAERE|nr:hypothetical protein CRE_11500 [Caenorhabditis remanei]